MRIYTLITIFQRVLKIFSPCFVQMKVEYPYFTNQKFFTPIHKFFTPYLDLKIHVSKEKYGFLYNFQAQKEGVKN